MENSISCLPFEKDTPAGSAGEAGEPGKAVDLGTEGQFGTRESKRTKHLAFSHHIFMFPSHRVLV